MDTIGHLVKELEFDLELKMEEKNLLSLLMESERKIFKENSVMVCGGALTSIFSNTKVNDIDCYFRTKEDYEKTLDSLKKDHCNITIKTKNATSLKNSITGQAIQLITLEQYYVSTPKEVYSQFDFTISQAAYDFQSGSFDLGINFLKHLSQRALVFNVKAYHPINSFFRVDKFIKRGFTISKIENFKVIVALTQVKLNNYNDLVDQLNAVSHSTNSKLRNKIASKKMEFEPFTVDGLLKLLEETENDFLQGDSVTFEKLAF